MNLDKLNLNNDVNGVSRVNEIMGMQVNNSNLLPKPITYKDIDESLTDFVSNNFKTIAGTQDVKTFFLAQQRMSEFTKTWEMLDENKNIIPNFKIVTRENNPKPGTLQGGMCNIPGEPFFNIGTFNKWDGNKNITVTCKMKQPYCVDIIYNVKFVTNRLNLLNELNNSVINEFKSKQSYIVVNGHYMSVILDDIGDESDYDLDQRKIFVQNFQLKVAGYIINENDIIFEENISRALIGVEINNNKHNLKVGYNENDIIIEFPSKSKSIMTFKADNDYDILNIGLPENSNILSYSIKVNNLIVGTNFHITKYDRIQIFIQRISFNEPSKIILITNIIPT